MSKKEDLEAKVAGSQKEEAYGLNLLGGSAIPDLNSILAFRVLREDASDANKKLFLNLLRDETKYLEAALQLLDSQPILRMKLGGFNIKSAMSLSAVLRKKAEEQNFEGYLNESISTLIDNEYKGTKGAKDKGALSELSGHTPKLFLFKQ